MAAKKMKNILYRMPVLIFLLGLLSIVIALVVRHIQRENLIKRYFCINEMLYRISREQREYHDKFNKYANFADLVKFSQDKIIRKLAKTAKEGIATRYGYNYCIYRLNKDTHSPIHFFGKTEPPHNMLCYAWPKDIGKYPMFAFAIDVDGNFYTYRENDGRYLGNRKPEFHDALVGVNKAWVTAGGDGDLAHEEEKKAGCYSCD